MCVIVQGRKETMLGGRTYRYDPTRYLVVSSELPVSSRITDASPEHPYLGVVLNLDPGVIGSVMVDIGLVGMRNPTTISAIDVSLLDEGLFDAIVRLVQLADNPQDARFLAPLIKREIVYRLLMGEQRERVCQIAALGGHLQRVVAAIERLRHEFDRPLRVEDLASELGMSVSGFHHHFKAVTAMSPLQFQKQFRLQEARRLMLDEHLDAASAGYQVGYHDAAHFSREYKRKFGEPPMRDVERLRGTTLDGDGI